MTEFQVILKARNLVRECGIVAAPTDLNILAAKANCKIKVVDDLADDESGQTTRIKNQHIVLVNGNHPLTRQRFTILHELGHIFLELPSAHHGSTLTTNALLRYRNRPEEEVHCDIFAAECLLPYHLFKHDVGDTDVSLDAIRALAEKYESSLTATASRFAANALVPCAFVLSEAGRIRYVARSKSMQDLNMWVAPGRVLPPQSVACRLCHDSTDQEGFDELPTDIWFDRHAKSSQLLSEESMVLREWDQCITLLWFDEMAQPATERVSSDDDVLLEELDGTLTWPTKRRRK